MTVLSVSLRHTLRFCFNKSQCKIYSSVENRRIVNKEMHFIKTNLKINKAKSENTFLWMTSSYKIFCRSFWCVFVNHEIFVVLIHEFWRQGIWPPTRKPKVIWPCIFPCLLNWPLKIFCVLYITYFLHYLFWFNAMILKFV